MASPSSSSSSPLRTSYLILYNAISAAAWSVVLFRTLTTAVMGPGFEHTYDAVGQWTRLTQTAASLEVAHAALGLVRAPVATTAMQVASRLLLVWGITYPHPAVARATPFYASMLVAWSLAEVLRYSYFATALVSGGGGVGGTGGTGVRVPSALVFLRYSAFYVLYPLGIGSECSLVFITSRLLTGLDRYLLYAIMAVYVPGSYIMYTHMMKQRAKMLGGGAKKTQ